MKGQILHIDPRTGEGLITGSDGRRYAFDADDLLGSGQIARPGVAVDFEPRGERAAEIYPDPGGPLLARRSGNRSRVVAGLLAVFFGYLGVHKFYLGYNRAGLIMLAGSMLGWIMLFIPSILVWIVAMAEAVIYLTRSDEQFHDTYELGEREWF
ncbi:TM2 domain-containing protein [Paracoccus alkenifer]|uniref:TM2 domain-containing protein n=1 Tax=Paracoccus alkenifer TaxID=65735 RepID=A0A1H6LCR9_9RHOB|nr:TM2 domain-containing protein [Paracoccus alkenifer]SEH86432.1 TM2 domain-containing protein [Paracoccus alkenifer]